MNLTFPISDTKSELTKSDANGTALHAALSDARHLPMGPFVRLGDGRILCVDGRNALVSRDEGAAWESQAVFGPAQAFCVRPEYVLLRARSGVLILAFINEDEKRWTWNDELRDAPGAVLPACVVRSLDDGMTWEAPRTLHADWTGAVRAILQTQDGRIVFSTQKMLHAPGRHGVLSYSSEDDGATWTPSNVIDLGGNGHHGGVCEGTMVELADGRILHLIRTNWGQFWRADSVDGGRSWRPMGPSGIDASSAPGILHRLGSGRIALVWTRAWPEAEREYPLVGGDGIWSAVPVSNFRKEFTVAFSDDECETWSRPVVVARKGEDGTMAYPYLFERAPGELWLTSMFGDLRVTFREDDLVEAGLKAL